MERLSGLAQNFSLNFGSLGPSYLKAGIIIFLLFILLLVLAKLSRGYIGWYMSGWYIWLGLGFLLAVIIEGFLIVGGSSIIITGLGWKNAPKPISTTLEAGREKLITVLGVSDTIPESSAVPPTYRSVVSDFERLLPDDATQVRLMICQPPQ